jgi:hypothetical protein
VAAAAALVGGAAVMAAGAASAAPAPAPAPAPLNVTMKAESGGSTGWTTSGDPVLTVGSDSSKTYAEMQVNDPSAAAPKTAPAFTVDNYTAGSPRWVIEFKSGDELLGYPSQSGEANGWDVTGGPAGYHYNVAYADALTLVKADAKTNPVTGAFIVADGDQAAGTSDVLSGVQYNGQTLSGMDGVGPISTFVNHSASCLDNRGFTWADGNPQQLWDCGASGGADQNYRIADFDGTTVLQAVAPAGTTGGPWCVTSRGAGATTRGLVIETCGTGSGSQAIQKTGAEYQFSNGLVMDDAGFDTANGSAVIGYGANGGKNQMWSLP